MNEPSDSDDAAPAGMSGQFDPEQLVEMVRSPITLDSIRAVVRQTFGLPPDFDFTPKDNRAHIAFAREVAMYLVRELLGWSYPRIGLSFKREHTTVIHANRLVARRIEKSPQFAVMIEEMKRKCRWAAR